MASKAKGSSKSSATAKQASSTVASSSSTTSNTSNSACVIIPPQDLWDRIQEIRGEHDTSFDRWPPHINLLWPFIPQSSFADAAQKISSNSKFLAIKPFTVRFSTFSFTRGSRYVHLVADILDQETREKLPWPPVFEKGKRKDATEITTPMQVLFQTLMELFPGCERPFLDHDGNPTEHFLPHLSVGQVEQKTIRDTVANLQSGWAPIEFEVTELTFLARAGPNKPFQTILTIPLPET